MRSRSFGRPALLISCLWILAVGLFYYPKWKQEGTEATLSWDVSGYYFYLPATFIYRDLDRLAFKDSLLARYRPATSPYQSWQLPNGKWVMKYASGMALMYSPAFFLAHALAPAFGYPADGFSYPYQLAIGLWSLVVALVGLVFLYRVLRVYFTGPVSGLTLLLFVFGTNYLEYSAITNAMPHSYLFTVYALLIWCSIRFTAAPSRTRALAIGALCGLATITRPTEAICVLIPLLWGLRSLRELGARIGWLLKHYALPLALPFLLLLSIQLGYWKWVSGQWFVYSYGNEKLEWLQPHIYKCLFSFRKGWFIYTPLMLLVVPGWVLLYRRRRELFAATLVFGLLFMYLCFAWVIWWYAGSIGQRAMVQAYPVLAFPFAAALERILEWLGKTGKKAAKAMLVPLLAACCCLLVYYNLWLHYQAHTGGLLDPEHMTRAYWQRTVLRYSVPPETVKLLDTDEAFEGTVKDLEPVLVADRPMELGKDMEFTPAHSFSSDPATHRWVRAEARIQLQGREDNIWRMTQFILRFSKGGRKVKERMIRVQRLLKADESGAVFFDVRLPRDFDRAEVFFWNPGSTLPLTITALRVEAHN